MLPTVNACDRVYITPLFARSVVECSFRDLWESDGCEADHSKHKIPAHSDMNYTGISIIWDWWKASVQPHGPPIRKLKAHQLNIWAVHKLIKHDRFAGRCFLLNPWLIWKRMFCQNANTWADVFITTYSRKYATSLSSKPQYKSDYLETPW